MWSTAVATIVLTVMLGSSASVAGSAPQTDDPGMLLRAAVEKEEVDGDLQGAIELYTRIVTTFADRAGVAAKAQLRIGICFEKLGKTEAVKAYEAVLAKFPEEVEVVAEARARLAVLRKEETAALTITRLKPPEVYLESQTLSPDGTKVAGLDFTTGQNVAVFDLETEKRELITTFDWSESSCSTNIPVWSPTSKEIAYQASCWGPAGAELGLEVRIATLAGASRLLFRNPDGGLAPCDWLPDGSAVVTVLGAKDTSSSLGLITVRGGKFRQLCPLQRKFSVANVPQGEASDSADVSPDGRFIAFSDGPSGASRDIAVIPVDGGPAVVLTDHPADDKEPRWSPDGRHIVFLSLRHGSWALWGVAVKDGKPEGQPFLILEGMQDSQLASWTSKGLLSRTMAVVHDLYTMEIDPQSHDVRGAPQVVDFSPSGTNICPVWSPDGKHLAFVSNSVENPKEAFVVVTPAVGGAARTFRIPTHNFWNMTFRDLRWLPDSSALGFSTNDNQQRYAVFRLRLDSGEWKSWPIPDVTYSSIEWGAEGKTFAYVRWGEDETGRGIIERDPETAQERTLLHTEVFTPPYTWAMKASRDRKKLARPSSQGKVQVIEWETGKAVTLQWEEEQLTTPAWSPDGKYLVAAGRPTKEEELNHLYIVSVADGKLKDLDLSRQVPRKASIIGPDWSPDGKRIAFFTRMWKIETNLIRNVIPET